MGKLWRQIDIISQLVIERLYLQAMQHSVIFSCLKISRFNEQTQFFMPVYVGAIEKLKSNKQGGYHEVGGGQRKVLPPCNNVYQSFGSI